MSQIQVRDADGRGVHRINVRISEGTKSSDEAIFDYDTDEAGNKGWPIPFWPVGEYTLHVNKRSVNPNYEEASVTVHPDAIGDFDNVRIELQRKASAVPHPNPAPGGPARTGVVRLEGRAARDDQGKKHFLGTSLFWMMQGFRTERARAEENMEWFASEGGDYIRVITQVNWAGREINPTAPDHEQVLGDVIDSAYGHRLRVQPTLVGDPTTKHLLIAERYGNVARTRAEKIVYTEMINEWTNDKKGTRDDMKAMARKLRSMGVTGLLGLSELRPATPAEKKAEVFKAAEEMRADMAEVDAHVFIDHTDRGSGDLDWRMVRQAYDFKNSGNDNTASNQEGPGPASSVNVLTDPRRLALMAWISWMCHCGFFTLHCGAGVTGIADPSRGRPANLWEVPNIQAILKAIRFAQSMLPEDVQNWRVVNNGSSGSPHPLRLDSRVGVGFWEGSSEGSVNKNYMVLSPNGKDFIGVLTGPKGFGSAEVRDVLCGVAKQSCVVQAIDPVTEVVIEQEVKAGKEWILPGRKDTEAGYLVIGQLT